MVVLLYPNKLKNWDLDEAKASGFTRSKEGLYCIRSLNRESFRLRLKPILQLVWVYQRAATSVPLNIAEGAGEYSGAEKSRFYRIAKRSATECAGICAFDS